MAQGEIPNTFFSAGIDLGTSTTKMVISKMTVENTAKISTFPQVEIIKREIVYESPVIATPLISGNEINVVAIEHFLKQQYENAHLDVADIKAGALIITGETATRANAQSVAKYLANTFGEFLVATAGPDLEAILAAKGSGAFTLSQKTDEVIANIDIGGGTANIAVVANGEVIGTATLHMGGHLITYERNKVKSIAPSIIRLLERKKLRYTVGMAKDELIEAKIIGCMVEQLERVLDGDELMSELSLLLGHPPNWSREVEVIMFSGGVSAYLDTQPTSSSQLPFEDIGKAIAKRLLQSKALKTYKWHVASETVRATVIGAGMRATEISGATINLEQDVLPLQNIPLIYCDLQENLHNAASILNAGVEQYEMLHNMSAENSPFALYLTQLPYLNFQKVTQLAEQILAAWPNSHSLIVVIMQQDYGKVLGQTLRRLAPHKQIICIDQIRSQVGDYIDIGQPLAQGVVPVVIKTLYFHKA